LNWLFLFAGTIYTGAVGPTILSVVWRKQTKAAVISGAIGGMFVGIICWLVVAKTYYGELTVATTGAMYPTMSGNLGSCCSGFIISIIVTLIKPDNEFDWSETKRINPRARKLDKQRRAAVAALQGRAPEPEPETTAEDESEKKVDADTRTSSVKDDQSMDDKVENYEELKKSLVFATWSTSALTFITIFLIPIPMFLSHYVFSLNFFKAWVIICVIWLFTAAFITSLLPIWESRRAMVDIFNGLVRDVFGGGLRKSKQVSGA